MILILVHGTSGNNNDWDEAIPHINKYLQPNKIVRFGWKTGVLWALNREKAAQRLKTMIEIYQKENPKEQIIVLGFSHGGNIAFLANEKLSIKLDEIITIGCPWLGFYNKEYRTPTPWTAVLSEEDGVQKMASFSFSGKYEQIAKEAEEIIRIKGKDHRELRDSPETYYNLKDRIVAAGHQRDSHR